VATPGHGDDHGCEAGNSGMRHDSSTTRNIRRLERTPIDHIKRLLEVVYPNHAYPVRYKPKDCGMMRSFMTSGSLTWGADPDGGLERSDAMPLPEENAVMTVLRGCLPSGSRRMSSLSPRVVTHGGEG
jgi:hypothetical protein